MSQQVAIDWYTAKADFLSDILELNLVARRVKDLDLHNKLTDSSVDGGWLGALRDN